MKFIIHARIRDKETLINYLIDDLGIPQSTVNRMTNAELITESMSAELENAGCYLDYWEEE